MKILLAACAETAIIDSANGGVSLINIVDRLFVPGFPTFVPKIAFFVLLQRDLDEPDEIGATIRVRIGDSYDQRATHPIRFSGRRESRLVANFLGLPISAPATIEFSLSADGLFDVTHSVPVEKLLMQQEFPFKQTAVAPSDTPVIAGRASAADREQTERSQ